MQEQGVFDDTQEDIDNRNRRLSMNINIGDRKYNRNRHRLHSSRQEGEKERMEVWLKDSLHRLEELEEENNKLKIQFKAMKETAEKLMQEKEVLIQKLEQKVQNINQLQYYLREENTTDNPQFGKQEERELKLKTEEIIYLREEYREELQKREDEIYELNELLEMEKERAEEFEKNDFNLNKRLEELEHENVLLEQELTESKSSIFDLRKSLADKRMENIEYKQQKIMSTIEVSKRLPTIETETDTTYAIHSMEEKIERLKQINKEEKERFRMQMESMREFYQGQLEMIRIELGQEDNEKENRLVMGETTKNKAIINIEENVENKLEVGIPLKQQIYQAARKYDQFSLRVVESAENRSVFTEKYFSTDSFIFKHQMEEIADQQSFCQQQQPISKISLVESRQHSIRSSKGFPNARSVLYIMGVGALVLYATKKIFQRNSL